MIPSQRQIERLQQMDIYNYGYDDENGDYQTVLKDHIGYRFEVLQALAVVLLQREGADALREAVQRDLESTYSGTPVEGEGRDRKAVPEDGFGHF